jgi:hypothetical protein
MRTIGLAGALLVAVAASASAQKEKEQNRAAQEIPADQRPPKGMCRIWLKDVPAAQQPAPTDCAAAVKNCPPNGRVIFGDTEESKTKPKADPAAINGDKKSTPMTKSLVGTKAHPITKPPVAPRKPPT